MQRSCVRSDYRSRWLQMHRMEDFGARNSDADSFCRHAVAQADLFVTIIGTEYGSCAPGSEFSFTEGEYNAAVEAKKPILAFVADDHFRVLAHEVEGDAARQKQQKFREKALTTRLVAFFSDPAKFAIKLVQAILNCEWEPIAEPLTTLLFSFLSHRFGFDTGIAISNIPRFSGESFVMALAFTATIHLYGSSETNPIVRTYVVPPGSVFTILVSAISPDFQGYAIVECHFPARGFTFFTNPRKGTGSYLAEVVTRPSLDLALNRLREHAKETDLE